MGALDFLRRERRDTLSLDKVMGIVGQRGGHIEVTPDSVLAHCSAAGACSRVIGETLAGVPLSLYRRGETGARERVTDTPLADLLRWQWAPGADAFEARATMAQDLLFAGNAYLRIDRGSDGQVTALVRLEPLQVTLEELASGALRYRHKGAVLLESEVLHIKRPAAPGGSNRIGRSIIAEHRELFALWLELARTQRGVLKSTARVGAVLTAPTKLSLEAVERIRAGLEQIQDTGKAMILDNGSTFQTVTPRGDTELVSVRAALTLEVCRAFNVPPSVVGASDKAPYATFEGEARALVTNAIAPLAARIESAMNLALFDPQERRELFVEHDLAGLLRGDVQARMASYAAGRQWGWLSPNDIRRLENLPPIEGGDRYDAPVNMGRLDGKGGAV